MKNLRPFTLRYNIINISSTIILLSIFCIELANLNWILYVFLDNESFALLLFWPLALLAGIITLNKNRMKKKIHEANKYQYESNNIYADFKKDVGSLTASEYELVPKFTKIQGSMSLSFKMDNKFYGELADLGLKYYVDDFSHKVSVDISKTKHEIKKKIYKFKGNALIAEYNKEIFGNEPIIIFNERHASLVHNAHLARINYKFDDLSVEKNFAILTEDHQISEREISIIRSGVEGHPNLFHNNSAMYIIFYKNRMVYFTEQHHKFKLKLSFIITKRGLEKIIQNQKAQVYRFNMLLNTISQMF